MLTRWLVALAVVAAAAGGWLAQGWRQEARIEVLRADHARQVAEQHAAHAAALDAVRAREADIAERVERIAHDAQAAAVAVAADARRADAAGRGLRDAVAAVAANCPRVAAPAGAAASSPAAGAPGDLLAELQRRLDDAAGELAAHADRARAAGLACERAYDAVSGG